MSDSAGETSASAQQGSIPPRPDSPITDVAQTRTSSLLSPWRFALHHLLQWGRPRVPLFRRAKVVRKSSKEPGYFPENVVQPATIETSTSLPEKRHAPTEGHSRLFSKTQKSIAYKLPRSKILDLTEDPLFFTLPDQEAPGETSSLNPPTSESLPEEGADSAPKSKIGYSANFLDLPYTLRGGFQITEDSNLWKKSDAFRASHPLLLEWIRKDYNSIHNPLEVHGAVARHLIRAMNASYAIACSVDLLDDARERHVRRKGLQNSESRS
ncbi:hypothetical protein LIER_37766 [Lithospermum erythrorhizon]|uniref:Uncharacterized protein n=1 Tax=Lithospermum erythrorhizon TaxID=34254 RepID=A0AAV3PS92_LITER